MRKKLLTIFCLIMVLTLSMAMLVGCIVPEVPEVPEVPGGGDGTIDPPKPPEVKPITLTLKTLPYTGAQYNGEKGILDSDTYVAVLKGNIKTDTGSCRASISIKKVTINGVDATAQEIAKFSIISGSGTGEITTTETTISVSVKFGDFSDLKYAGAIFLFTLEADPYVE